MTTEYTRPNYLEVSSHFLHDAIDYEIRYKHCMNSDGPLFYTPRSRRLKTFIDLRMGVESALKSLIVYFEHNERNGKTLINWIEKFSHKIGKLLNKAKPHLPRDLLEKHGERIIDLSKLPVGLRYRLDAWDFHGSQEELYYNTIGSDVWLGELHKCLQALIGICDTELSKHTRILSGDDLLKEVLEPRYEKYT